MERRFVVAANGQDRNHEHWLEACRRRGVAHRLVDLSAGDWLERVAESPRDCLLAIPPGHSTLFKQMYDERLYILHQLLGERIYPSFEEILVYENKRMLAYWLQANRVPHPATRVFYQQDAALGFAAGCPLPVVAKSALGASATGVHVLRSRSALESYIDQAFSAGGVRRAWGPNLRRTGLGRRLLRRLADLPGALRYFRQKRRIVRSDPQRGHVILQEFVRVKTEWRCVRIGDSFFGHQKLARGGGLASGTSLVGWEAPPEALLDFVRDVTDRRGFLSQAVDVFETPGGDYLVNELQAFFGSRNPHQMIRDGVPGRFLRRAGRWLFEAGDFNTGMSFDLRLEHALALLRDGEREGG